jgi:hypothetical protein
LTTETFLTSITPNALAVLQIHYLFCGEDNRDEKANKENANTLLLIAPGIVTSWGLGSSMVVDESESILQSDLL